MPLTRNDIYFEENEDHISFVIKMVHPKTYKFIFALLSTISLAATFSLIIIFNIFDHLGPMSFVPLTLGLIVSFVFFKTYMWHHRGEEFFLLAIDNISHQINNGIKLSELKSYEAIKYNIDFIPTDEYESKQVGTLLFYTVDPSTKLKNFVLQSTLEITIDEYEFIEMEYMKIKEMSTQKLVNINLN